MSPELQQRSTPGAVASRPRAEAVIDVEALRHNVALLSARARESGAETMVIVKADGYGHGVDTVARAALKSGASCLGVASPEEAVRLRELGIRAPMLCWLYAPGQDFRPVLAADVEVTASSIGELFAIADTAADLGKRPQVHLKIDTGLNRNGCRLELWPGLVAEAARLEAQGRLRVNAIWSHLACADEPGHPSIDAQARVFEEAYRQARAQGLKPLRHLANSAALLTRPDLHFDLVRPGIAAYGLDPVPQHGEHGLRPAMTFRSAVTQTKALNAGDSVSYGHTWAAPHAGRVALVPVGYADGVPRALSGQFEVWVNGARRPVVGRVCMDQIVVWCGDQSDGTAEVVGGDEVILFGTGDQGEPTAAEWAQKLGTIDYEIVTGMFRPRVVRRVVGE